MNKKIMWLEPIPPHHKMAEDIPEVGMCFDRDPAERMVPIIKEAANKDTQIDFQFLDRSAYRLDNAYLQMLNNVVMVDKIIEAEKQGYAAVVISCAPDPGIKEARQAVDIPVVSAGEAAMLLALNFGQKFGIVTVQHDIVGIFEDNIRTYGLRDRSVPVRTLDHSEDGLAAQGRYLQDPNRLNPQFENLCLASIADGAEVIIPACTSTSSSLRSIGYTEVPGTGVPVIDINHAAVKQAETLVDLHRIGYRRSQSKRSRYSSLPPEARDHMRALVGNIDGAAATSSALATSAA